MLISPPLQLWEPFIHDEEEMVKTAILCAKPVPLDWNFDSAFKEFAKYGSIKEIRNRLGRKYEVFEYWIIFTKETEAHRAYKEFSHNTIYVKLSKAEDVPRYLDIYRPQNEVEDHSTGAKTSRSPDPAKWLTITTQ